MILQANFARKGLSFFPFFHSLLLVSTRAIMARGEQGKIKKRTYHDWLVQ